MRRASTRQLNARTSQDTSATKPARPAKVSISRRQVWQLQLTVAGRFEGQRFRQWLGQGQERVGELGNVQRQLALPYAEVDAIVQRFAEYCRGVAQQLAGL